MTRTSLLLVAAASALAAAQARAATVAAAPAAATPDAAAARRQATYANPIDLPYRYQAGPVPYREAADPTVVLFRGSYWLFVSHSRGYWHSRDLRHWSFVEPTGYDVGSYAPTAVVMGDSIYLTTSEDPKKIWVSDDPASGRWRIAANLPITIYDPCLFLDADGRLYLYEGLHPTGTIGGVELDRTTLQPIGAITRFPATRDTATRGWEVVGDANERQAQPTFIEGAWMNRHADRYYLQYAAPGTEFKTYADGVVVGDHPLGPFRYESYNPFSVKPTGFIAGAGHSSTFQATDGGWWRMSTMTISRRHIFERRLGLFPTRFTGDGQLIADTYLGDYPHFIDGDRGLTGWMLLSRGKAASASSSLPGHAPGQAVDEEVRTWWSAASGAAGEWFAVDLGGVKRIEAVQVNFADQDSRGAGISRDAYRYRLEVSADGRRWTTAVDATADGRDAPHDYRVLDTPRDARFVRLTNAHSPDGGKFSLYDLRVFGSGGGAKPAPVGDAAFARDARDARRARISWRAAPGAEFYVVRLGVRPDLMNQAYQVYDGRTSLDVASLNVGPDYVFAVDAVNENGIAAGTVLKARR